MNFLIWITILFIPEVASSEATEQGQIWRTLVTIVSSKVETGLSSLFAGITTDNPLHSGGYLIVDGQVKRFGSWSWPLVSVSVGPTGIWAFSKYGTSSDILKCLWMDNTKARNDQGIYWEVIENLPLTSVTNVDIDAGPTGIVYAMADNNICSRTGISNMILKGSGWNCTSMDVTHLSCGVGGCYFVYETQITFKQENKTDVKFATPSDKHISHIDAGLNYELWVVTTGNYVYRRNGTGAHSPDGSYWKLVSGIKLKTISIGIFGPVGISASSSGKAVILNGSPSVGRKQQLDELCEKTCTSDDRILHCSARLSLWPTPANDYEWKCYQMLMSTLFRRPLYGNRKIQMWLDQACNDPTINSLSVQPSLANYHAYYDEGKLKCRDISLKLPISQPQIHEKLKDLIQASCSEISLGFESGLFPSSGLSAVHYSADAPPQQARFKIGNRGWCSNASKNFFNIDFLFVHEICAIKLRLRGYQFDRLTLLYSKDGKDWLEYIQDLNGKDDAKQILPVYIKARYLRLEFTSPKYNADKYCMKLEVYGSSQAFEADSCEYYAKELAATKDGIYVAYPAQGAERKLLHCVGLQSTNYLDVRSIPIDSTDLKLHWDFTTAANLTWQGRRPTRRHVVGKSALILLINQSASLGDFRATCISDPETCLDGLSFKMRLWFADYDMVSTSKSKSIIWRSGAMSSRGFELSVTGANIIFTVFGKHIIFECRGTVTSFQNWIHIVGTWFKQLQVVELILDNIVTKCKPIAWPVYIGSYDFDGELWLGPISAGQGFVVLQDFSIWMRALDGNKRENLSPEVPEDWTPWSTCAWPCNQTRYRKCPSSGCNIHITEYRTCHDIPECGLRMEWPLRNTINLTWKEECPTCRDLVANPSLILPMNTTVSLDNFHGKCLSDPNLCLDGLTFEIWLWFAEYDHQNHSKTSIILQCKGFDFSATSRNVSFGLYNGDFISKCTVGIDNFNRWIHFVGVWLKDSSSIDLYVDGMIASNSVVCCFHNYSEFDDGGVRNSSDAISPLSPAGKTAGRGDAGKTAGIAAGGCGGNACKTSGGGGSGDGDNDKAADDGELLLGPIPKVGQGFIVAQNLSIWMRALSSSELQRLFKQDSPTLPGDWEGWSGQCVQPNCRKKRFRKCRSEECNVDIVETAECSVCRECEIGGNHCGVNAMCNGSFACACNPGFTGNGVDCFDIDECFENHLNNCSVYANCSNTEGSFACACNHGFSGDGVNCSDIDECLKTHLNSCSVNAKCSNTEGSFACACNHGYSGDGVNCSDIDECFKNHLNNCSVNAKCSNTDGSFTCECNPGFSGDGVNCSDIDECKLHNLNYCSVNAECNNTIGSFTCTCNYGFSGNGIDCFAFAPPTNCKEVLYQGGDVSGIYFIDLSPEKTISVYCEQSLWEGGWLVILRRNNSGELNFKRIWKDYRNGFGKPKSEFWIGNDNLYQITRHMNFTLMLYFGGNKSPVHTSCATFNVASEKEKFALKLKHCKGPVSHALSYSNGAKFSTFDNDVSEGNCAQQYEGGWWYKNCSKVFLTSPRLNNTLVVSYYTENGSLVELHDVTIMIKPFYHARYRDLNIRLKFLNENWTEELKYDTTHAFFLLSGKIRQNMKNVYSDDTSYVSATVHSFRPGSVIASITITYSTIDGAQVPSLVLDLDHGYLNGKMAVSYNYSDFEILDPSVPSEWPRIVELYNTSSTSFFIRWSQITSSTKIQGYKIYRKTLASTKWSMYKVTGNNFSRTFPGLEIFTTYLVYVSAYTVNGNGLPSPVHNVTTDESVPVVGPNNLTAYWNKSSHAVHVTWSVIPRSLARGYVTHYVIVYSNGTNKVKKTCRTTSIVLTGLLEFTEYNISVTGATRIGTGASSSILYRTRGPPLSAPENLTVINATSTLNVSWSAIPDSLMSDELLGYRVYFYDQTHMRNITILADQTQVTISDVKANIFYQITVVGFTVEFREGRRASTGIIIKNITAPLLPPRSLSCSGASPYTISIRWYQFADNETGGSLKGYVVSYKARGNPSPKINITLPAYPPWYTLANLPVLTKYDIDVTVFNEKGRSLPTNITCKTEPGAPNVSPQNFQAHSKVGENFISVSWQHAPDSQASGTRQGYKLLYQKVSDSGSKAKDTDLKKLAFSEDTTKAVVSGLDRYSKYCFRLLVFNEHFDGIPTGSVCAETCRCPHTLYTNWFVHDPYVITSSSGIFPPLIKGMIRDACGSCQANDTVLVNFKIDGRGEQARKNTLKQVQQDKTTEATQFSFPVIGPKTGSTGRAGSFIPVIDDPSSVFITRKPVVHTIVESAIGQSVVDTLPLFGLTLVMMMLGAILMWAVECSQNEDTFPKCFSKGVPQGFWWAFVSVTTVGYGDKVPTTIAGRFFSMIWILYGTVLIGLITVGFTTALTITVVQTFTTEAKDLYGSKVAALDRPEIQLGFMKGAIVNHGRNFSDIHSILKAVENGDVDGALIDKLVAAQLNALRDPNSVLMVKDVIQKQSTYGIYLTGHANKLHKKFRQYLQNSADFVTRQIKKYSQPLETGTGFKQDEHEQAQSEETSDGTIISLPIFLPLLIWTSSVLIFLIIVALAWHFVYYKHVAAAAKKNQVSAIVESKMDASSLRTFLKDFGAETCRKLQEIKTQHIEEWRCMRKVAAKMSQNPSAHRN